MATAEYSVATRDSSASARAQSFDSNILATTAIENEELSNQWNAIVDQPLIEWGMNPKHEDEDGLVSPTGDAIAAAYRLVDYMRQQEDWRLPTGVIADGEGGIVFENKHDPVYQTVEIDSTGNMNLYTYEDCKLISHEPLNLLFK